MKNAFAVVLALGVLLALWTDDWRFLLIVILALVFSPPGYDPAVRFKERMQRWKDEQ